MISWTQIAKDYGLDKEYLIKEVMVKEYLIKEVMVAAMTFGVVALRKAGEPEFICTVDGDSTLQDYELVVRSRNEN